MTSPERYDQALADVFGGVASDGSAPAAGAPCDNCDCTGMDSTDHGFEGQPAEVHPCGYCLEGRLPS